MNTRAPGFNADDEPWDTFGDERTAIALVAAIAARELDDAEREGTISSLRRFVEPDDYDLMMAAGDLGGAEVDLWDMTL